MKIFPTIFLFFSIIIITLLYNSCKHEPTNPLIPPTTKPSLSLQVTAQGQHDVILQLKNEAKDTTTHYTLMRDKNFLLNGIFTGKDTILYDLNLLGNSHYEYQAVRLRNSQVIDSSNVVVAQTREYDSTFIDTTSHDFIWTVTKIGDGQSWLNDIFALNPNDVWAVGQIRFVDSTGKPDQIHQLNAVHWDGTEWKGLYIPVRTAFDTSEHRVLLKAVYLFGSDDIWFASLYSSFVHWDGNKYTSLIVTQKEGRGVPTKIFGFNNNSIYFAGTNGSLTYWDGSKFKLIETNTNSDINDIYGYGGSIFAVASNWLSGDAISKLIQIQNQQSVFFNENGLFKGLTSIWFHSMDRIYAFGGNVQMWNGQEWVSIWNPNFGKGLIHSIRGESENDIFAVGDLSTINHFNGRTWKWFKDLDPTANMTFYAASTLPNELYVVGEDSQGHGVIVHGKRK